MSYPNIDEAVKEISERHGVPEEKVWKKIEDKIEPEAEDESGRAKLGKILKMGGALGLATALGFSVNEMASASPDPDREVITGRGMGTANNPFPQSHFESISTEQLFSNSIPVSYSIYERNGTIYADPQGRGLPKFSDSDFATVFNNAMNELHPIGGGKILIRGRDNPYLVTTPLHYHHRISIEGEGVSTELKLADGVNDNLIEPKDTTQDALEVVIEKILLNGNKANNTSGHCLAVDSFASRFNLVWIRDAPQNGIRYLSTSGEDNYFSQIRVANCGSENVYLNSPTSHWSQCIFDKGGSGLNVYANQVGHFFDNCYIYAGGGITFENSKVGGVTNSRINVANQENGVYVLPTAISGKDTYPERLRICNNLIEGDFKTGVWLDGQNYWVEDVVVANNTFNYTSAADASWPGKFIYNRTSTGVRAYINNNTFINTGGGVIDQPNLPSEGHVNFLNEESAAAETPTASKYPVGTVVDFTDTGDGSGTGVYKLKFDGTWVQIA